MLLAPMGACLGLLVRMTVLVTQERREERLLGEHLQMQPSYDAREDMLQVHARGLPWLPVRTSLQTDASLRHPGMVWLWQRQWLRKQRQTCKRDMLISAGRYRDEDHSRSVRSTSLASVMWRGE